MLAKNQQSYSAASDCAGRIVAATKATANIPASESRSSTLPVSARAACRVHVVDHIGMSTATSVIALGEMRMVGRQIDITVRHGVKRQELVFETIECGVVRGAPFGRWVRTGRSIVEVEGRQ